MSNSTPRLKAIVLAGGRSSVEFERETGVTNRALAELAPGKTMLDFILDALAGSQLVGSVVVVGDLSEQNPAPPVTDDGSLIAGDPPVSIKADESRGAFRRYRDTVFVLPGETLIDNLEIGLRAINAESQDKVLLVSADIPFIDTEAVDSYTAQAIASGADLCYPIVPMAEYNKRFAQMKRTTLKLREGEYTGGNIILMRAGVVTGNPAAVRGAYAARKSVPGLGKMLGWGLLTRIIISQVAVPWLLTVPLLETAIGNMLGKGVLVRAIRTNHASLGTDVDKPDDVRIAREMLSPKAISTSA